MTDRKSFTRDDLADQMREAWFYADAYPHNRRWLAVADAAYTAMATQPAEEATAVDEEIRLIALCLDVLDGTDPKLAGRVLRYLTDRLVNAKFVPTYPQF